MDNYKQGIKEEESYLEKTLKIIEILKNKTSEALQKRKTKLLESRRDMWENSTHHAQELSNAVELNQYLSEVSNQSTSYEKTKKQLQIYKTMSDSPYFGRFDFIEEGFNNADKIYIGIHTVIHPETGDICVYDWRAPISSIFYRYEPGEASYTAPVGVISGEVTLKRQYKISKSKLFYYFDCSVRIGDEILQEALRRNSSVKMRTIVETIQKEQDIIIRDQENDLLIVQGVAGSGKTSIALHRIAFLLYEGMDSGLKSDNILILSPNNVFSGYISEVLPELGEDNVNQKTFIEIFNECFDSKIRVETRDTQIEDIIETASQDERTYKRKSLEFKGSNEFLKIIDGLLWHYEHKLLEFSDVYYHGQIIETRESLKNSFLNNKTSVPAAKRLERIENRILDKVNPLQKERLHDIQKTVQRVGGHEFDLKAFSRLLSIKETRAFTDKLHVFTRIDVINLYKRLFSDMKLFYKLANGLKLPEEMNRILSDTLECLEFGKIRYEDAAPLLYLKIRLEGCDFYSDLKQVVIDEAQDYYPIHYKIFSWIFRNARFTVLGDVNQSIEKQTDISIYDEISELMHKSKTIKLFLNKSYRSSFEINTFTSRLLKNTGSVVPFERHESKPRLEKRLSIAELEEAIVTDINALFKEGYKSIAVICKTQKEAEKLYFRLKERVNIKLLTQEDEFSQGAVVIPVYMAKGLEFDAVILFDAGGVNYFDEYDRKLLYVACTRALHRLIINYTGNISRFLL